MQSTDDPLAGVSQWEVWGLVWLSYLSVMGLVVLIYDWLLTLDDEVRLIFSYFFPALLPVPRCALSGQALIPCRNHSITSTAIYPLSSLCMQTTVSTTYYLAGGLER